MSGADHAIVLRLAATPEAVPIARHALAAVAEREDADALAVKAVVSELVGNAVIHAYAGARSGPVLVTALIEDGLLVVTVADEGLGLGPRLGSPGLGIGIPLSGKLAHDLRIEVDDTGTIVSASFALPADAEVSAERTAEFGVDRAMREARRLLNESRRTPGKLQPPPSSAGSGAFGIRPGLN